MAQAYEPPRTRDGHPDFGGVWGATFITPLERPEFAKELVLRQDEAASFTSTFLSGIPEVIDPDFQVQAVSDIARVRGELRSSQIITPADGQLPFTEKAGKLAARSLELDEFGFDNPEERPTFERCLAGMGQAPIRQLPGLIPNLFVQTHDALVIATEDAASLRIIHLDGRRPPPESMRSFEGYSAGHWDGDTLVIETTHTRADDLYRGLLGRPVVVEPDSKVVERMTRISPTELHYQFTVEDSDLYAAPWLAEYVFTLRDIPWYEYACHEGNRSMVSMLVAGRMGRQPKPKPKPKE
jgi:hypothetical protein